MPDADWIKDTFGRAFSAEGWGPVEVFVVRTDEDALVRVILSHQTDEFGRTAVSTFRFMTGVDIDRIIQRDAKKAVERTARNIAQANARNRRFDA